MRAWCLVLTIAAGCSFPSMGGNDPNAGKPAPGGGAVMPGPIGPAGAKDPARPPGYKLVVTIKLMTIEVPVGTASGSEEVWSYLDEEPVKTFQSANLGRNGFRVGLGREGSLADVARIFKRMTGRSPQQNMIATIPGDPLPIILKERQSERTIFTFRGDRTLAGRDYPQGDYLLAVVCTLDEDDHSKIMMTAMPQVRSSRRETRYVLGATGPEMVVHSVVHPLTDMTFQVMVPSKGFLVIGPGIAARNPTSVGHHFLVKQRDGMEFETLLVLIPEVLAAPMR